MSKVRQSYKYYCVVDFEATNDGRPWKPEQSNESYPSEIIQFPAVLIDGSTAEFVDTFNRYVKPSRNPVLSNFILRLTNIAQSVVDNANSFISVLDEFETWLGKYSTKPFYDVCFITDGKYDFGEILMSECQISGISRPTYMNSCHNIKESFKAKYKRKYYDNTTSMLNYIGMSFSGTQHNGFDDAYNIARVAQHMLKKTFTKFDKNEFYY